MECPIGSTVLIMDDEVGPMEYGARGIVRDALGDERLVECEHEERYWISIEVLQEVDFRR